MAHEFGGPWTEEKLGILEGYLKAYLQIFHGNERARWFKKLYVDAFAGTGERTEESTVAPLFEELDQDADVVGFKRGSATIALDLNPGFDQYVFIEQKRPFVAELRSNLAAFDKDTLVVPGEANEQLAKLAEDIDWRRTRAVVFLDPYGMQVEWRTIEALAATHAVDLWLLFPIGQAVTRLLTREPPTGGWARRLTAFFGSEEWRTAFYSESPQFEMFDEAPRQERTVNWQAIEKYFVRRLMTVFPVVATNPRRLHNSMSVPLYLLFFAAANPKGGRTAIKIASHLLEKF